MLPKTHDTLSMLTTVWVTISGNFSILRFELNRSKWHILSGFCAKSNDHIIAHATPILDDFELKTAVPGRLHRLPTVLELVKTQTRIDLHSRTHASSVALNVCKYLPAKMATSVSTQKQLLTTYFCICPMAMPQAPLHVHTLLWHYINTVCVYLSFSNKHSKRRLTKHVSGVTGWIWRIPKQEAQLPQR